MARQRPRFVRTWLWCMFGTLFLGELATTIWWVYELSFQDLLLLCAPLISGCALSLCMLSLEQVAATLISLALATVPALPAYSAVVLLVPPMHSSADTCWELLHVPTLLALAVIYVTSALLSALQAECPSGGELVETTRSILGKAQCLARAVCGLAVWLYLFVALHMGSMHLLAREQSPFSSWGAALASPLTGSRGFLLGLHALGLACTE